MRTTNLKQCNDNKGNADCSIEDFGASMNGVARRGDFLYVNDFFGKVIHKYRIN